MELMREDLVATTVDVWSTMLGLDLEEADGAARPTGGVFSATIHVTGAANWSLQIECSRRHAITATGAMFMMTEDEMSSSEIIDALGELANVVGGNVKGMIEGAERLSLPTVVEGEGITVRVPGVAERHRIHFDHDGEPVALTLFEQSDEAAVRRQPANAAVA